VAALSGVRSLLGCSSVGRVFLLRDFVFVHGERQLSWDGCSFEGVFFVFEFLGDCCFVCLFWHGDCAGASIGFFDWDNAQKKFLVDFAFK